MVGRPILLLERGAALLLGGGSFYAISNKITSLLQRSAGSAGGAVQVMRYLFRWLMPLQWSIFRPAPLERGRRTADKAEPRFFGYTKIYSTC